VAELGIDMIEPIRITDIRKPSQSLRTLDLPHLFEVE